MKTLTLKWTGRRPMIFHNGQLVDPENPYVKEMKEIRADKRGKDQSEADIARAAFVEWQAGWYWDKELGPVLPADNIERCLQQAAAKSKQQPVFKACVFATEPVIKIEYDGPRQKQALYADPRFTLRLSVVVQRQRIMRIRPCIPQGWWMYVTLEYDEREVKSEKLIIDTATKAGALIGLGDYRPKYGRFTSDVV